MKYKFEIQACIGVVIETDKNIEDARLMIVDNINEYADDMVKDCFVSDGVEIKTTNKPCPICGKSPCELL